MPLEDVNSGGTGTVLTVGQAPYLVPSGMGSNEWVGYPLGPNDLSSLGLVTLQVGPYLVKGPTWYRALKHLSHSRA